MTKWRDLSNPILHWHDLPERFRPWKTVCKRFTVGYRVVKDAVRETLTTNLAFKNWTEVLGNERLRGATLDQITHRCHIVELADESYRLQDAKRRRMST